MSKIITIADYEFKMLIKNKMVWIILTVVVVLALYDNFPSESNYLRLQYLPEQGYVVRRILSQFGVMLLFALMFIISSRISIDINQKYLDFLLPINIAKHQYILGKFIGSYIFAVLILNLYLFINGSIQFFFSSYTFKIIPYFIGGFILVPTTTFFVVSCSISLPILLNAKLFYVLSSTYFLLNTGIIYVENEIIRSFYLYQPDILKLLYKHEGFEFIDIPLLYWNFIFLIVIGIISMILLVFKKSYWRE